MIGVTIIRREEQTPSMWSGYPATQLAAWPGNATSAKGDFSWWLGITSLQREEALFPPLPGVSRPVMPLERDITLVQGGNPPVSLNAFETGVLDAREETRLHGSGLLFDLMLRKPFSGYLGWICEDVASVWRPASPILSFKGVYSLCEEVKFSLTATPGIASYSLTLRRNDFLLITHKDTEYTIKVTRHTGSGPQGILCVTADTHADQ